MKQVTLWKPDTCDCVIVYEWDDAVPVEARTHVGIDHPHTRVCAAHQAHRGRPSEQHTAVLAENRRKNAAVAAAADRHGVGLEEIEWSLDPVTREPIAAKRGRPA